MAAKPFSSRHHGPASPGAGGSNQLADTVKMTFGPKVSDVVLDRKPGPPTVTTAATAYSHAIFREGLKHVAGGANPIEIKRGLDAAVEAVSPCFVTDPQTMEMILEDAYILIHTARRSTRRPPTTTARSSGSVSPS